MSAEDLDKLFRDKLQNRPVAPSNVVWERMQARMQPPVEKEEKKPVMWYWSAAAAIVLLITVSIWMLKPGQQINQGSVPMAAKVEKIGPAKASQPEIEKEGNKIIEKFPSAQATGSQAIASIQTEGVSANTRNGVAPSKKRNVVTSTPQEKRNQVAPRTLQTAEPEMMAQASTPVATKGTTTASSASLASAEPLEIIVKLDNNMAEPTKLAMTTPEPVQEKEHNNGRSTGKVVKGIFKQVKNLSQGEKIDLKELGLKHTYALETQIGNKKISKTITL